MGYDATNFLPSSVTPTAVVKFLRSMGYQRSGKRKYEGLVFEELWYLSSTDYASHQPIVASVYRDQKTTNVETHCRIARSRFDARFHNHTVRELLGRFGGWFVTDEGKGRYFSVSGDERTEAESGCYLATWSFLNDLTRLVIVNDYGKHQRSQQQKLRYFDISTHLLLPAAVSLVERWFRDTYEAILRFSPRRSEVLRQFRIAALDLIDDDGKQLPVEKVVTRYVSFQNIDRALEAFKKLEPRLGLKQAINPSRKRKSSTLYYKLDDLMHRRHRVIHGFYIDPDYEERSLERDLHTVRDAVYSMYRCVCKHYKWKIDKIGDI